MTQAGQETRRHALLLAIVLTALPALLPGASFAKGGDGEGDYIPGTPERPTIFHPGCDPGLAQLLGCGPPAVDCAGSSMSCWAISGCGGNSQRACCGGFLEGFPCLSNLIEVPVDPDSIGLCSGFAGGCICGGNNGNFLATSSTTCIAPTPCGGVGQRACCPGEVTGFPCPNSDFVREVDGCTNCFCGLQASIPGIPAISRCEAVEPCGGEGQRACCLTELDHLNRTTGCDPGLVEAPGCDDTFSDCTCGGTLRTDITFQSSGTCVAITPCGGSGQRGCCVGEAGRTFPTDPACGMGLTEVPDGCTGNCYCGDNALGTGAMSSSTCIDLQKPVQEPSTDCTPGSPGCPLRGYADLHVHMFGHLAHGGLAFVGEPVDPVGGVASALRQDAWMTAVNDAGITLVDKAGVPLPDLDQNACADMNAISLANLTWTGTQCQDELGRRVVRRHGFHDVLHDTLGAGTFDMAGNVDFTNIDTPAGPLGRNSPFGWPAFNSWPTWTTTVHQQVYYKWLERAYKGGLRLMVMMAVNSEAACRTGIRLDGVDCRMSMLPPDRLHELDRFDDRFKLIPGFAPVNLPPIELQLQAAYEFEDWLNQQPGGGWFKIVRTPQEARQAMAQGKLAVVLSIEVDNLFNCHAENSGPDFPDGSPRPPCTEADVLRGIEKYYEKGVRHVFPVHNFDNAFAGTATWINSLNIGNRAVEGHWFDTKECELAPAPVDPPSDDGYGYKVSLGFLEQLLFAIGFPDVDFDDLIQEQFPVYDQNGLATSCNVRGLSDDLAPAARRNLGTTLIDGMIDRGMLIDIDHMSIESLEDTLAIAEREDVPLIASHGLFFELHNKSYGDPGTGRHERLRTRRQLERMADLGSLVTVMLKDDAQPDFLRTKQTLPYISSTGMPLIRDDCRHSTKTWAQSYQYAVDVLGAPVALGSDFNGVAQHLGPRFGNQGCGGSATPATAFDPTDDGRNDERSAQEMAGNKLTYPFTLPGFGTFNRQTTGQKTFDFNYDGLAHIGLLPDMIADLKQIGLRDQDLEPLFRSAEAYVRVWEKADFVAGNAPDSGPSAIAECVPATVVEAGASCRAAASIAKPSLLTNPLVALSQAPAGPYALGSTAVELTATPDGSQSCEPPTTCVGKVIVQDTSGPSITCPANIVRECTGDSGAAVTFAANVGADNCDPNPDDDGCWPPSGSGFFLGQTEVACSAEDDSDNRSSCGFKVTVQDTQPPTISCPQGASVECTGNSSASFSPGPASASDVCGGVTVNAPGAGAYPLGTTTLPYTATDDVGLAASCTSSVRVVDTQPPTISCPQGASVECTANGGVIFTPLQASASDTCQSVTVNGPPAGYYGLGTTPLQYTATDAGGLVAGCSTSVTVVDTQPPTISCPQAASVECTGRDGASFSPGPASASDTCHWVTLSTPTAGTYPLGTTPLSYSATDHAGLTASCTTSLTVADTRPPAISCPPAASVECTGDSRAPFEPLPATASDTCRDAFVDNPDEGEFPLGTTALEYTASDGEFLSRCTSSVTVVDTQPPTITCPAGTSVECTGNGVAPFSPQAATASDSCGGVTVSPPGAGDFPVGTTTLAYTATDASGLSSSCSSSVTVVDTQQPTITCPQASSVECTANASAVFSPLPATTFDICGGETVIGPDVGAYPLGTTPLEYVVVDGAGLSQICVSSVTVVDTQPPTISCPQAASVECTGNGSAPFSPLPATAADACREVTVNAPGPGGFVMGTTPLPYTATDATGLGASCNSSVTVVDTLPPTISCPQPSAIECTGNSSAPFAPLPATASDICRDVTVNNPGAGSFPMGTTNLPYSAIDAAGLGAACSSSVTVADTQPPMITCPPTASVECTGNGGAPFTPAPALASDVCAGVTVDNPDAGIFPVGTSPLDYIAIDRVGLASSCSSDVTVIDTTPPTIAGIVATPDTLWSPNHKMREVVVSVDVFDVCDDGVRPPTCAITAVTANEALNDDGDGNTPGDWEITGALSVDLRAERAGLASGRVYTLEVTCADLAGNATVGFATVTVPRDRGGNGRG